MPFYAFIALMFALFLPQPAQAYSASDLETANKYYAEKSWQLAAAEYEKFIDQKADDALNREVVFKWSDSIVQLKDETRLKDAESRDS